MLSRRNKVQALVGDAGDTITGAVSALPVDDTIDVLGDVVEDLGEFALDAVEAAAATVTSTSRVGIRLVTRTARFVARHPREVFAGLVLVTLFAGVVAYLGKRDADAAG